ncbi:MAG: hypothetical protein ABW185_28525 [Sedimenticola sp.]
MNASQFATRVGISPATTVNWESGSGKLNLRQRTLDAMKKVVELTPERLKRNQYSQ